MSYHDKLSENEVLYTKIYSKWKQKIDRTQANERKKGTLPKNAAFPITSSIKEKANPLS